MLRRVTSKAEFDSGNPPPVMMEPVWRMLSDRSLLAFTVWAERLTGREQRVMADYMRGWE